MPPWHVPARPRLHHCAQTYGGCAPSQPQPGAQRGCTPLEPLHVVVLDPAPSQSVFIVVPLLFSMQPATGPLAGIPPHEVGSSSAQLMRQMVSFGMFAIVLRFTAWTQRPVLVMPHCVFALAVGQYGRHAPAKHVRPAAQSAVVLHPWP